jgi:hypothetical protein
VLAETTQCFMHDLPIVAYLCPSLNEILCDHCEGPLMGNAYRVLSEEDGVRLFDMVVCHACYLEARRIGLNATELRPTLPAAARA